MAIYAMRLGCAIGAGAGGAGVAMFGATTVYLTAFAVGTCAQRKERTIDRIGPLVTFALASTVCVYSSWKVMQAALTGFPSV